jgi:hypothetical protein
MQKIAFQEYTLYVQFYNNAGSVTAQIMRDVQLPCYPKAWRKHPLYDSAFQAAVASAAESIGLPSSAKIACLSLV